MSNKREKEREDSVGQEQKSSAPKKLATKAVRNRGTGKIELLINGEVVVFPPKSTVEVPEDFNVPSGIGLYVK